MSSAVISPTWREGGMEGGGTRACQIVNQRASKIRGEVQEEMCRRRGWGGYQGRNNAIIDHSLHTIPLSSGKVTQRGRTSRL